MNKNSWDSLIIYIQIVPPPKKKKIIGLSASISYEIVNWSEYALDMRGATGGAGGGGGGIPPYDFRYCFV